MLNLALQYVMYRILVAVTEPITQEMTGRFLTHAGIAQKLLFEVLFLGIILFGGSSKPPVVQGLQGVVQNPDIRANEKLQRCGRVSETTGCVLYIVNHTRNDRLAEDFIPEAVKLTGRQDFLIRIENPNYVKTRIPPGHFASIKIPRLR